MKKILPISLIALLIAGCGGAPAPLYYWGDYSKTLYDVKKEPGEASHGAHEQELLSIVKISKERNLRVPPGVYAELGVYALERGDQGVAKNYFNLEKEAYPESEVLMQRISDS